MAGNGELDEGQEGLDDLGDLGDGGGADEDDLDDELDEADDDGKDANPPADTPAPTAEDYAKLKRKAQRQEERITRLLKAQGKTVKRNAAGDVEDDKDTPATSAPDLDTRVKRQAGIAALTDAGMSRAAAKTAVKLLDLAGLEVDEDGEVDDAELEELVEELKEQFPGMFAKTGNGAATGSRLPKVRTAPTRKSAVPDDPTDRTTRALLRSAGFQVGRGR
jgi:hypothetical protein